MRCVCGGCNAGLACPWGGGVHTPCRSDHLRTATHWVYGQDGQGPRPLMFCPQDKSPLDDVTEQSVESQRSAVNKRSFSHQASTHPVSVQRPRGRSHAGRRAGAASFGSLVRGRDWLGFALSYFSRAKEKVLHPLLSVRSLRRGEPPFLTRGSATGPRRRRSWGDWRAPRSQVTAHGCRTGEELGPGPCPLRLGFGRLGTGVAEVALASHARLGTHPSGPGWSGFSLSSGLRDHWAGC